MSNSELVWLQVSARPDAWQFGEMRGRSFIHKRAEVRAMRLGQWEWRSWRVRIAGVWHGTHLRQGRASSRADAMRFAAHEWTEMAVNRG